MAASNAGVAGEDGNGTARLRDDAVSDAASTCSRVSVIKVEWHISPLIFRGEAGVYFFINIGYIYVLSIKAD